jgi:hypothetical protein
MKPLPMSQWSLPRLHKKLQAVIDEVSKTHPIEIQEILFLQQVIAKHGDRREGPYSTVRRGREAVKMLFVELGMDRKITKGEIQEELKERGYPLHTASKKGLLADAINYMIEAGDLVPLNDAVGRKQLLGVRASTTHKKLRSKFQEPS